MGVLGEFFGFDGRVNRIGYVWRSVVISIVLVVLCAGGTIGLPLLLRPDSVLGSMDLTRDILTATFLLALWSSFALGSRRLRDTGLEPTHFVPVYAACWVINAVLLQPMSQMEPMRFGALEIAWSAAQWLSAIPLIFWPSHEGPAAPPSRFDIPAQPTAYLNWRESA
jgi:uncharacterized membrane protein YhaH (DUF805 family)